MPRMRYALTLSALLFISGCSTTLSLWPGDDSTAEAKENVKSESVIDTVIVNPFRSGMSSLTSLWSDDEPATEEKDSVESKGVKDSDESESVFDTVIVNPLSSGMSSLTSLWSDDDPAAEEKETVEREAAKELAEREAAKELAEREAAKELAKREAAKELAEREAVKDSDESESVFDTVIVNPVSSGMSSLTSLWSDDESVAEEKESVESEAVKETEVVKDNDENESIFDTAIVNPVSSGVSSLAFLWSNDDSPKEETAIVDSVRSGVSVVWQVDLDQRRPAHPEGFSLPAVVHSDQEELIIAGAQDRRVRIYNAGGSELDRIALAAPGESGTLQLTNGLVVIGDIDGMLYGIDLAERKIAWRFALPSVLLSSPVSIGDDFIIQTAANHVYRMTADGKKVWSYTGMLGGLGMHLSASPAIHDNNVYAVFSNGDIVALKAANGSLLWKRQLLLDTEATVLSELKVPVSAPTIIPANQSGRDEDVLAVAVYQGEILFLSLRDGTVLGQRDLSLKSSPLLLGKHLYVADVSGSVSALNAANGETLWKQRISEGELVGPVLWQGSLWTADNQGMVYRLNLDGNVLASIELDGRIDRNPVVAANGVLVRNHLGTVYMLR